MTSLEPRTPHQPGKLQNVSKNDYVSTPPVFHVNQIHELLTCYSSIWCSPSTAGWRKNCAVTKAKRLDPSVYARFSKFLGLKQVAVPGKALDSPLCKSRENTLLLRNVLLRWAAALWSITMLAFPVKKFYCRIPSCPFLSLVVLGKWV